MPDTILIDRLLGHPDVAKPPDRNGEAKAWCPSHPDRAGGNPSLGINRDKLIVKCFVCGFGSMRELARLWGIEIQASTEGLTLEDYATAKSLNLSMLKDRFGLSTITRLDRKVVRIPYFLLGNMEGPTQKA